MKRIVRGVILLCFTLFFLGGCQMNKNSQTNSTESSQKETQAIDWLKGAWYSSEWDVTYTFTETNSVWKIKNGETVIGEDITLGKKSTGNSIQLVAKNGTKFNIEKIDQTHIKFQQEAKEGQLGLTNSVEFEKEK